MINKKIGVMTLGLTLMMLASCGPNSNKGNYVPPKAEGSDNITYFCPSTDVKYMEEVVAAFKAANPDYTGEITLQAEIGEGDVKAEVQKDINQFLFVGHHLVVVLVHRFSPPEGAV